MYFLRLPDIHAVCPKQNVLGWAGAYATGVVPVDLPQLTAPCTARRGASENAEPPVSNSVVQQHIYSLTPRTGNV